MPEKERKSAQRISRTLPFSSLKKPAKERKSLDTFQWKFLQVISKTDGKPEGASEVKWVFGDRI